MIGVADDKDLFGRVRVDHLDSLGSDERLSCAYPNVSEMRTRISFSNDGGNIPGGP